MNDIERLKASEPTSEITEALLSHGVVMVEGLLDPDLLARFNSDLDPLLDGADPARGRFINDGVAWFFGERTRHVTGIAAKSQVFATEILNHPIYMAVCDAVLSPNCARYVLNLAHVLDRGPGSEQQLLHRDQDVWFHLPTPHPEIQLASLLALVDFTADNGATRVVPDSHRWEPDRLPEEEELPRKCPQVPPSSISDPPFTPAVPTPLPTNGGAVCTSATALVGCGQRRTTTWPLRLRL
jgi:ectoine hydroxylase-related dioxygenase (phytanoyl-CoA dioxygenase family)